MGVHAGVAAEQAGGDFWQDGFWKGAIVGGAAGALGGSGITPLGTEWLGTTLWGAGLGTATQAGGIWAMGGDDYSQIWQGALIGGAIGFMASEQFGNLTKGKGFTNNQAVYEDFSSGMYTSEGGVWQQDYIDYRGINAEYVPGDKQSSVWFNKNDHSQYGIRFRDHAFGSYYDFQDTYAKEIFTYRRFSKGGIEGLELGDVEVFGAAKYPEERLGIINQYRNQGLYSRGHGTYFNKIAHTESMISMYNLGTYNTPYNFTPYTHKWWHFIYEIPRIW